MSANLAPSIRQRFFDSNGAALAGGKLYSYQAGTTTPQATYTDSGAGTPNANPVVLSASGEADVWLDPSLSYKFVLKDSSDVVQWTVDNVIGVLAANAVSTSSIQNSAVTAIKLDSTAIGIGNTVNLGLSASVGSSALTVSLTDAAGSTPSASSPVVISFRNASAATGTPVVRSATAATSIVISSGSTLGQLSAVAEYIYVYAIDNAGTVELAVSTTIRPDEGSLVTTTALAGSGADDSRSTLYSTTARSNVAIRLIGRIKSTQTVAGTWATSPSEIAVAPFKAAQNVPTIQKFTSTGTTTGYLFTISTSTTCAVGDTYTNNSNTYTVLGALSATSGQVLFMSGASAPTSSGTLTRSSGAGTSSVTFTAAKALATYTLPTGPTPLYIRVRMVGGGGGGSGSGSPGTAGNGGNGTGSFFGTNLLSAGGGVGGAFASSGGDGGSGSLGSGPTGTALAGGTGLGGGSYYGNDGTATAGQGGSSAFGGGGGGGYSSTGDAGKANTGGGGGGGGGNGVAATTIVAGAGGGAGGFVDALITSSVQTTYVYCVGAAGTEGTAGTNGFHGGAGGSGYIEITEYYQ